MKLLTDRKIKRVRISPRLRELLKFGGVFVIFFWFSVHKLDPDFGWHLQAGNYFRQHGLPSSDIYSYTASNFDWINHEWAHDILVSFLYGWTSYVGLAVVFSLIWTLVFWIAGRNVGMITMLAAVSAVLPYSGVRALTWSALFFAILLRLCQIKNKRKLIFIPLLILVWANFHGSFALGLFVIVFYLIKKRRKDWVLILALSILASFINLNGPQAYVEIFRTMFDHEIHTQIGEWHSFSLMYTGMIYVALWVTGFWFFSKNRLKNWFDLPPILLAASMSATRNLPLFVIASLKQTDEHLKKLYHVTLDTRGIKKAERIKKGIVAAFVAAVVVATGIFNWPVPSYKVQFDHEYPKKSVAYLQEHGCAGNVFSAYDYGGYLIWKLPQYKVYIDGRMPSWKDESGVKYMDRYFDVIDKPEVRDKEFERYNVQCLILGVGALKMIPSLGDSWKIVGEGSDQHYGLYVKQ